jgi:tetrahydromethanopterin S-methyltransferase subunit B
MQAGLITMLMGLISYSYAVLKLPGSQEIWEEAGYWTNVVFSIAGSGLSAVIFILYDLLLNKKGEN